MVQQAESILAQIACSIFDQIAWAWSILVQIAGAWSISLEAAIGKQSCTYPSLSVGQATILPQSDSYETNMGGPMSGKCGSTI